MSPGAQTAVGPGARADKTQLGLLPPPRQGLHRRRTAASGAQSLAILRFWLQAAEITALAASNRRLGDDKARLKAKVTSGRAGLCAAHAAHPRVAAHKLRCSSRRLLSDNGRQQSSVSRCSF